MGERTPQRIQLRRTKGWRLPEGAIVVSRPTRWGNPFHRAGSAEHPATAFRRWITLQLTPEAWNMARAAERELRGHDLACWCPLPEPGRPDHCHAAVLLEIANAPDPQS